MRPAFRRTLDSQQFQYGYIPKPSLVLVFVSTYHPLTYLIWLDFFNARTLQYSGAIYRYLLISMVALSAGVVIKLLGDWL